MKKATYLFLVLMAFGSALSEENNGKAQIDVKNSITVLREVPPCPEECSCDVYSKQSTNRIAVCPSIPKSLHPNINYLKITGNIGYISKKAIQEIGQLNHLDLSGCNISKIETGAFDSLDYLVSLNLSVNNIETISNDMFASPRLIYLDLGQNVLQEIQNTAFSKLIKLRQLDLKQNLLKEMSFVLPSTVDDLDVSHNDISTITTDLSQVKLKILNLCGNKLENFPSIISSRSLEVLCLEGEAALLPTEMATNYPSLTTVTLVGLQKLQSGLDSTTQSELVKMRRLEVLTLVNYHLKSLSFLANLENLRTLNIHNVTVESYKDIERALQRISTLNIDWSPTLVKPILGNTTLMVELSNIRILSLKHTELVSLSKHNVPGIKQLDISENPLHCDCKLVWIQHQEIDHLSKFLLSKPKTTCNTPPNAEGQTMQTIVHILLCNDNNQQSEGNLTQEKDIPKPTTTTNQYVLRTTNRYATTLKYDYTNSTEQSQQSKMTEESDNATLYIILGCVIGILLVVGIVLAVILTSMKRKRKCQISPNEGETPMQQQPMKEARSSDQLIKK